MRRVFSFLYGNVAASFPSDFPMTASVERLRGRTTRTVFSTLFRPAVVGRVSESSVRLQRHNPVFGNSFKPVFVGRFERRQSRVVLEGRFTMLLFSRIFMTVWFGFAIVWTTTSAAATLWAQRYKDPVDALSPLIGVFFVTFGVAFVRIGWWLSRSDMAFLTWVIESALKSEASSSV